MQNVKWAWVNYLSCGPVNNCQQRNTAALPPTSTLRYTPFALQPSIKQYKVGWTFLLFLIPMHCMLNPLITGTCSLCNVSPPRRP